MNNRSNLYVLYKTDLFIKITVNIISYQIENNNI